jgi:hypothetical protein
MKCDEVQLLQGPFLDSELDARTTLEIGEHLKSCAECARLFAEEQKLEARMKGGLNRGQRTAALWEQIERSVVAASVAGEGASHRTRGGRAPLQPQGYGSVWLALGGQLLAGWQHSRWAWAGLAAVWVVIVGLNFAGGEAEGARLAEKQLPPASEVRFAVKQKRLLMADLAALAEPASADKARVAPPSPRSDRRKETLNT